MAISNLPVHRATIPREAPGQWQIIVDAITGTGCPSR